MSYTTIYYADQDGDMRPGRDFSNSYRGAMAVWGGLGKRYCDIGEPGLLLIRQDLMRQVWDLAGNENIPEEDRLTLMTTFDQALARGEMLPRLADCFEATAAKIGLNHLVEQAAYLRELVADGVRAVGWRQTSVCENPWRIWDDDGEEGRPYNINRDAAHWWIGE